MIDIESALFIGIFCGFGIGYPIGFMMSRIIYKQASRFNNKE